MRQNSNSKLVERWSQDDHYARIMGYAKKRSLQHADEFMAENTSNISCLNHATTSGWLSETSAGMFVNQLDVSIEFGDLLGRVTNPETGKVMLDLRGINMDYGIFERAIISDADLSFSYSVFHNPYGIFYGTIKNSYLFMCDLSGNCLENYLVNTRFVKCDLRQCSMRCTYIEKCDFSGCNISYPRSFMVKAETVSFHKCSFRGTYFAYGYYKNTLFEKCNFLNADMETSRFINCEFVECNLEKAKKKPMMEVV